MWDKRQTRYHSGLLAPCRGAEVHITATSRPSDVSRCFLHVPRCIGINNVLQWATYILYDVLGRTERVCSLACGACTWGWGLADELHSYGLYLNLQTVRAYRVCNPACPRHPGIMHDAACPVSAINPGYAYAGRLS